MVIDYDDLLNKINTENSIKLYSTEYTLPSPLVINNTSCITGGSFSKINGQLIIHTNILIKNVTFLNNNSDKLIIIKNNCKASFKDCTFIGNSSNIGIYIEPHANSELILQTCTFSNFFAGISLNETNMLSLVKNCTFQFCKTGINSITSKCIIIEDNITDNLIFNSKEGIFLSFDKLFSCRDYYSFCFKLCANNNYARIIGYTSKCKFDTISYYVDNIDNLKIILNKSPCCSTIFLKDGIYSQKSSAAQSKEQKQLSNISYIDAQVYNPFSDIIITHPVHLIGIHSPTIKKEYKDNYNQSYGIRIASSNIIIENIKIDGGSHYNFRDGIHFEKTGFNNITLDNITILRTARRGISLFGNNTDDITIKNCFFYNTKGQAAIYTVNKVSIYKCRFFQIDTGIICNDNSKLILQDNIFENMVSCIKNCNLKNIIQQSDNKFKYVENITLYDSN